MNEPSIDKSDYSSIPEDATLVRRFKSGDEDAATQLYLRYSEKLLRLAKLKSSAQLKQRVDPESIVQSVFRTFFRRASEGQYDVASGEELWKLLLVIALNKIRTMANFHSAKKRDSRLTIPFPQSVEVTSNQNELAFSILKMTIDELTVSMSESQKSIILFRIDGHSVDEIAIKTGRAKRSIERVLQKFRQRLSIVFQEGEQ